MVVRDTSMLKRKKETEKGKNTNLSTLLSPPMAIEGSEIKINTGKDCNDGLKIFNDEGSKSDLETKSNRWLETR